MWTGAVNWKVLVKESYWAPTVRRLSIPLTVQLPGLRQRSANLCWSELGSVRKQTRWCLRLTPPDVALPSPSYSTRLALQLYDGLAKQGTVIAEAEDRRILEAAAMLHEVGRSRGPQGHRKRAYSMIRRLTPPLGWSAEELQCVAVIARYHGGALPQTSNSAFVGLAPR